MKIRSIESIEILDSRGNPTIETTVVLEDGSTGTAAVPSGASTGSYEAHELRDGGERYLGAGVLQAIANIDKIAEALVGFDAEDQSGLDNKMIELDGTENKSSLGANAILSVSLAAAVASAKAENKPLFAYLAKFNPDFDGKYKLPIPMMNIMNGGKHANWATDIQEYMVLPVGAKTETEAVCMCAEVYQNLKKVLKAKGYNTAVGDEGGFAPVVKTNDEPFELMIEAIEKAGYKPGQDVYLGIDAAATEFYHDGKYVLNKEGKTLSADELIEFYAGLVEKFPIISMEDIFAEDDWETFAKFHNRFPSVQLVGDDLYVTNIKRLERGINESTTNSILIKLNQIGTLTETVKAVMMARANKMTAVISHRSGETEDTFIADLSAALGTGQIKTGAPARSERTAKYNRLMKIEKQLGGSAEYSQWPFEIK
ncbi:MAG: phosphopyruvate hydratase [Patescibacteria group bacterium]|nr:phosphopyruvate hydratase [Patescibacteria group bacterium]